VAIELRIQYGEHATFEFGASRHRQSGERGSSTLVGWCAKRADHVQKLAGVEGGSRSVAQHVVVTGVLSLDAQPMSCEPDERIEPEDGDGDLRGELRQCVEALHVRHLVHEYEAASRFRPFICVWRQQNCGIDDAPCDGNAKSIAVQQRQRSIDTESRRCALSE